MSFSFGARRFITVFSLGADLSNFSLIQTALIILRRSSSNCFFTSLMQKDTVGVVTDFWQQQEICLFFAGIQNGFRAHSAGNMGSLRGHQADHSPASVKVNSEWSYTSTFPLIFLRILLIAFLLEGDGI